MGCWGDGVLVGRTDIPVRLIGAGYKKKKRKKYIHVEAVV